MKGGYCPFWAFFDFLFLPRPVKVPDFIGGGTPLPAEALGGPWPFIIDLGSPMRLPELECFLGPGAPFKMDPLPMYIMPGGALESSASRDFDRFFFFLSFLL